MCVCHPFLSMTSSFSLEHIVLSGTRSFRHCHQSSRKLKVPHCEAEDGKFACVAEE